MKQDRDSDQLADIFQPTVVAGLVFVGILLFLGWDAVVFRAIARLFYEQSALAALRQPSQIVLTHYLSWVGFGFLILLSIAWKWLSPHARRWMLIVAVACSIRAVIWVAGSNLPLVPGDSCHCVEISSSILRGEGPVKQVYLDTLAGRVPPDQGHILSLAA